MMGRFPVQSSDRPLGKVPPEQVLRFFHFWKLQFLLRFGLLLAAITPLIQLWPGFANLSRIASTHVQVHSVKFNMII